MFVQQSLSRLFHLFLAGACMLVLAACQATPEESGPLKEVAFLVSNYRQVSFDDLASSATTRAVPTDHPSTLAHLLIAIFDANTGQLIGAPLQHDQKDYTRQDQWDAYRQFSVMLPYGRYRVLVLGYNGQRACHITSPSHITWDDDYVPNTFLYEEVLTLDENTNLTREITLRHVVAAFRVTAEDMLPSTLRKMRFSCSAGGTVLDGTTGFAPQSTGRTSEIVVPADSLGKNNIDFTTYLFLPEEQIMTDYSVQAIGDNGVVLNEKCFSNVPLRINYLTQWRGNAFESGDVDTPDAEGSFRIKWDTAWEGTISIDN